MNVDLENEDFKKHDNPTEEQENSDTAALIHYAIFEILRDVKLKDGRPLLWKQDEFISESVLFLVAAYAIRDMRRIDDEQNHQTSLTKLIAYIGFWFSRLKPIRGVYKPKENDEECEEITDINERITPILAMWLLRDYTAIAPEILPKRWIGCKEKRCGKNNYGNCFFRRYNDYLNADNGKHYKYLIYCLRFRPVGPYFLVDSIDQAIYMSCQENIHELPVSQETI